MINNPEHKKSGFVISIIARQEWGKSPVVKRLIQHFAFKRNILFDPQREYDPLKFSLFRDPQIFKKYIGDKFKCFIGVEEATTFVQAHKDEDWTAFCVNIAHRNCVGVFVFHSMIDAPKSILNKSRFVYIGHTMDDESDIKSSRKRYYPYYMKAKKLRLGEFIIVDNYKI